MIGFLERGEDIGRDPHAVHVGGVRVDGHGPDPVLLEQGLRQRPRRQAVDPHIRDGRRPPRLGRRVHRDAGNAADLAGPAFLQLAQAGLLPGRANPLVERERVQDRELRGHRMRAHMVELANIVVRVVGLAEERPQARDPVAPHVEQAVPQRRPQPLVEARAVVVAAEVRDPEVEMREGVGAIHHHRHAVRVRHVADFPDREDLPRDVHQVGHHQEPRAGTEAALVEPDNLVVGRGMPGQGHDAVDDPVAPRLHPEHVEHGAVILGGHHRLVPGLPLDAGNHGVERLGGVAGDDELLGCAAGEFRQLAPHGQPVVLHPGPQVVRTAEILVAHPGQRRLEHRLGHDAVVAVLEVDPLGIEAVLGADAGPEVGPGRRRGGGLGRGARGQVTAGGRDGQAGHGHRPDEFAFVHGRSAGRNRG